MRIDSPGSSGALPAVAAGGLTGGVRLYREAQSFGGMPVERVIEGELLNNRRSAAVATPVAHLWPFGAGRPGDAVPEGGDLYASRASAAIGRYLDTAFMDGSRAAARVALDLYV